MTQCDYLGLSWETAATTHHTLEHSEGSIVHYPVVNERSHILLSLLIFYSIQYQETRKHSADGNKTMNVSIWQLARKFTDVDTNRLITVRTGHILILLTLLLSVSLTGSLCEQSADQSTTGAPPLSARSDPVRPSLSTFIWSFKKVLQKRKRRISWRG